MTGRSRSVAATAGGAAILAVLIWRLGFGPFAAGLRAVDAGAVVAAAAITAITTLCCAWRWRVAAGGLGLALPLRWAVAAYYRSQFLNTVVPGGILGDVHRAVAHGRRVGQVGRGARAVLWERLAGQAAQVGIALAVLVALPSPIRPAMPIVLAVLAGIAVLVLGIVAAAGSAGEKVIAAGAGPKTAAHDAGRLPRPPAWVRVVRAALSDVRLAVLGRRAWPAIGAAGVVVVTGHVGIFLIAAHLADPDAAASQVLPLAMLVLLASAVPLHVAGWGAREGVAAWAFGAAGLGAAHGVAAATVYGVLAVSSSLPGGIVLLWSWCHRARPVEHRGVAGVADAARLSLAAREEVVRG